MFQENDLVVYGNTGVCRVKAVGPLDDISAAKKDRLYYTLEPLYDKGTIYIPADTKVFMRLVITKDEANDLISRIPDIRENNYDGQNLRMLSDNYEASLNTHNCEDLVQLIRTVFVRNQKAAENGKKPAQTDERYMKKAKDLLHGELAAALGIDYDDVEAYIDNAVNGR